MDLIVSRTGRVWRARFAGHAWPCAVGPNGIQSNKREGDGATPAGRWPLRRVLFPDSAKGIPASEATPIEPRIDEPAATGETFSAVGYGLTEPGGQTSGTR